MVGWTRPVGLERDNGNRLKNVDKHGVALTEAEQVFFNESPLLVVPDRRHSDAEIRVHALGRTDEGRPLQITFTVRGDGTRIRIISARDMSRKERSFYDQIPYNPA